LKQVSNSQSVIFYAFQHCMTSSYELVQHKNQFNILQNHM